MRQSGIKHVMNAIYTGKSCTCITVDGVMWNNFPSSATLENQTDFVVPAPDRQNKSNLTTPIDYLSEQHQ